MPKSRSNLNLDDSNKHVEALLDHIEETQAKWDAACTIRPVSVGKIQMDKHAGEYRAACQTLTIYLQKLWSSGARLHLPQTVQENE